MDAATNRTPPDGHHREHIVEFYSDDDAFLDSWVEILSSAIETGDAAICVATASRHEELAKRFERRFQRTTVPRDQVRYLCLDASETLSAAMSNGTFDQDRASELFATAISRARKAAKRNSRVVVLGEMVALLWSEGNGEDVVRWEHLCNHLCRDVEISVHCGYPIRSFHPKRDSEYLGMICAEHTDALLPAGLYEGSGDSIRVAAEAEQLIQKDAKLEYPNWQTHYRATLLETSRRSLFKLMEIAEAAVLTRLHILQSGTGNIVEQQYLVRAWAGLQSIKKRKLIFRDRGWGSRFLLLEADRTLGKSKQCRETTGHPGE